jgi:hypothetical protein
MNNMQDKKRIGLIVTLVTVFLCGCPGLIAVVVGGGAAISGNTQSIVGSGLSIAAICIGVFLVAIPVAAGIYTCRQSQRSDELEDVEIPPPL